MYTRSNLAEKLNSNDNRKKRSQHKPKESQDPIIRLVKKLNAIFYLAAIAFVITISFVITNAHANIQVEQKKVTDLEKQLSELQQKNFERRLELDTCLNYDEIYKIATEELGMVYPSQDQIIYYETLNSDYVKQYSEIPK